MKKTRPKSSASQRLLRLMNKLAKTPPPFSEKQQLQLAQLVEAEKQERKTAQQTAQQGNLFIAQP